ncbi:MAG: 4-alpha-glucanotransferase [Smithella sp.]|nr:4-alpha-glucanotransferase [Smithella sp.]
MENRIVITTKLVYDENMKRGSGILLSISSLPGRFGIGTLGAGAREFVDQLRMSGQSYWQILPVSPTGFGDSPYQAFSTFAGNPYFIDFDDLYSVNLLPREALDQCADLFGCDPSAVDYYKQYICKARILRLAYEYSAHRLSAELDMFVKKHAGWIHDYALYMALKSTQDMKPFHQWPEELRQRRGDALKKAASRLGKDIHYHIFVQYLFFRQWDALRRYANARGVSIIGDMPIYMAPDGADAWTGQEILNKQGYVAGCPPDYFSSTGQLWGNPLYDWEALRKTGYQWWLRRIAHHIALFDYLRIDHFRAFEAYYAIPADADNAIGGQWIPGPGMDFFRTIEKELGELPLIAEDLGYLTPAVFELLRETGFPGLKVLHFAFAPDGSSIYLPHRYEKNCLVYTGTHDNDTTIGWFGELGEAERHFMDDYLGGVDEHCVHWQLIRLAMRSVADVCIIPMQDVLGLPSSARMNKPQTSQGNWRWRLAPGQFDEATRQKLAHMTWLYGRSS